MNGKEKLEGLTAAAVEAETEEEIKAGRRRKEAAILATVAKVGMGDSDLWEAFRGLEWQVDYETVAAAILSCLTEGVAIHPDTVKKRLSRPVPKGVLEDILNGSKAVEASIAKDYAEDLGKLDRENRALEAAVTFKAAVKAGKIDTAPAALVRSVCEMVETRNLVKKYPTEGEDFRGFLKNLADRRADGRDFIGLDCGLDHLNEVLNGLPEGVIVLAGAPSTGKTTLAKQIADTVAEREAVPVLFWSFEQSKEELRIKSLSRLAGVDSRLIWKGRTKPDAWGKVEDAGKEYRDKTGRWLTIIEGDRTDTVEKIRLAAVMKKYKAAAGRVLIVIDYLQIMPTPEAVRLDGIKDKVDFNLTELRRLSRFLKSPVLAISSQNRESYKGNKEPTLASLKESGGIEYSADVVLCLRRNKDESDKLEEDRLTRNPEDPKKIRVDGYVLKNRNGELAKIRLNFTPACGEFDDKAGKEDLGYDAALGE